MHRFVAKSCAPLYYLFLKLLFLERFYCFLVINCGTYDSSAPFSRLDKALKAASFILPTLEVSTLTTVQFVPCIRTVQTMGVREHRYRLEQMQKNLAVGLRSCESPGRRWRNHVAVTIRKKCHARAYTPLCTRKKTRGVVS